MFFKNCLSLSTRLVNRLFHVLQRMIKSPLFIIFMAALKGMENAEELEEEKEEASAGTWGWGQALPEVPRPHERLAGCQCVRSNM